MVPLNKITGEQIQGRDAIFRVVPVEKYQQMPRLTTVIRQEAGKKFKREIDVTVSIWEAALGAAQIAFFQAGANPKHLHADMIAQEYPNTGELVILFSAQIKGQEVLVPCVFQLTQQQIADLRVRGEWMDYRVN